MTLTIDHNHLTHLLQERMSRRAYSSAPVSDDSLDSLFEAMRWAPSSMNEQPWRVIYARKGEAAFDRILESLMESNRIWAKQAPVLMAVISSLYLKRNGKPNRHALYDTGQALGALTAQATAMGLVMRQMGGFEMEKLREKFSISQAFEPVCCIALGYPGKSEDLPEKYQDGEGKRTPRNPIAEFAFANEWKETNIHPTEG
jgi:nitroreductase